MRADVRSSNRSRTTARAVTGPAAPASPIRNREAISASIVPDQPQSRAAAANPEHPASKGGRRPRRSLIGPITSWPIARPARNIESVNCTAPADAPRSRAICGNAGRYISIASGENAVKDPSKTISPAGGRASTASGLLAMAGGERAGRGFGHGLDGLLGVHSFVLVGQASACLFGSENPEAG